MKILKKLSHHKIGIFQWIAEGNSELKLCFYHENFVRTFNELIKQTVYLHNVGRFIGTHEYTQRKTLTIIKIRTKYIPNKMLVNNIYHIA